MRIQIVSWRDPLNPKAGGAEVCLLEISRRLISRFEHQVSWFAPEFAGSSLTDEYQGIQIERRGRFAAVHLETLRRFLGKGRQTSDFYLEDYHGLTLGLSWFLRKPHVIFVHEVAGPIWFEMWKFPVSWTGFALEKLSLKFLRRAHFIAASRSTKQDLVDHGIAAMRIFTVNEASDIAFVESPRDRTSRAGQFLFIGRICKMKRIDLLLASFARHLARCASSKLVLVGTMDEDFRSEFESLTRRLRIENAVELRGRVSQEMKAELLGTSLALVSCSMREGFGLVVVEANSQGTPALTFDVNGYRDLIQNGINGFMVDFADVDALALKMCDLVEMDAARYQRLCDSSLRASRAYSWDQTAADVNRIIAQIIHSETEA